MAEKNQMRPIARNLKPPPPPKFYHDQKHSEPQKIAAFKTNVLPFQSVKKVRISHFENGPLVFYVQTESADNEFQRFNLRLQKVELRFINPHHAAIGMACLARYEKKIYRAAIAKVAQNQSQSFHVNFVDYGFNGSVSADNIFYIPDDFLNQFTFAMPFCLAGFKTKEMKASHDEINFYFRQLTENQILTLKCVPSDGPPIFQYCELLLDDQTSVKEKILSWDPHNVNIKFRPQNKLEMKVVLDVKVSYVESASEFFIHLQQPETLADYDFTCDALFKAMNHSPILRNPKPGNCCAVFLSGEWYRGTVIGFKNNRVQVKIVDFGIVEEIPEKQIHLLPEKFIDKSPFAFPCCLKGFEELEVSENISTQFDIFCGDGRGERKVFKMTILDTFKQSYLVELEDLSVSPPVNVNKMLLKNSRPLIETIQLENAKKRQKDTRRDGRSGSEGFEQTKTNERDRNSAQRGRGNYVNKGIQRNSSVQTNNQIDTRDLQQSPRTHFGKSSNEENSTKQIRGSKESTPNEQLNKSTDSDQPKKTKNVKNGKQNDLKSGWVSTLISVNRAFVHYDEHIEKLEKILDEMFGFYENNKSSEFGKFSIIIRLN
jgi:tudor domain-containing protein 1/4/6/7